MSDRPEECRKCSAGAPYILLVERLRRLSIYSCRRCGWLGYSEPPTARNWSGPGWVDLGIVRPAFAQLHKPIIRRIGQHPQCNESGMGNFPFILMVFLSGPQTFLKRSLNVPLALPIPLSFRILALDSWTGSR